MLIAQYQHPIKHRLKFSVMMLVAAAVASTSRGQGQVTARPDWDPASAPPPSIPIPPSIPLWSGDAPGSEGKTPAVRMRWIRLSNLHWEHWVSLVNSPAIIPFLPARGKATGAAVVVCPGGGHHALVIEDEGCTIGRWFADHGIAAFVLEYRLAGAADSTYSVEVHSLMDAQRAIRTIRSRARDWNVNPGAVGIMGFSAGGEVAFLAATLYNRPVPGTADAIDALDCRPDFQALFYPMLPRVQPALTADTPIAFLCGVSHDGLTPGMVNLYTSLTAAGVSSEMHIYSSGSHGFPPP